MALPPATFYGVIAPSVDFEFEIIDGEVVNQVHAEINGNLCGTGEIQFLDTLGSYVYSVQVKANSGDGCGNLNDQVRFFVDQCELLQSGVWNNSAAELQPLSIEAPSPIDCQIGETPAPTSTPTPVLTPQPTTSISPSPTPSPAPVPSSTPEPIGSAFKIYLPIIDR